jgi:hypothetical protein
LLGRLVHLGDGSIDLLDAGALRRSPSCPGAQSRNAGRTPRACRRVRRLILGESQCLLHAGTASFCVVDQILDLSDRCFVNDDYHGSQFDFYLIGRILASYQIKHTERKS